MKREEGANLSQASVSAHEITLILRNLKEKIAIIASLLISLDKEKTKGLDDAIDTIFTNDEDMLSLTFYKNDKMITKIKELINEKKLGGVSADYFLKLDQKLPFPIQRVLKGEFVILNRSTDASTLPIITLGFPLFINENGAVSYFAVADIKQTSFQKIFSELSERKRYLVGSDGIVLAHPDDALVLARQDLKNVGVVDQALKSKMAQGAANYMNFDNNRFYFGAFAHTQFGAVVISEIAESIILEPSAMIRREVYYLTGIILSLSFIVIFLFSLTLTRPIVILSRIATAIGKGNFDIPVVKLVNSTDEVGSLAFSVETMLGGLKERDKAKNILNKFHGSSVAQDLLASKTIERIGRRRDIAILFCDIRGFTAMSERMEPEEVVLLLNDYFNAMVKVITKNNGVIDKFIGDAIMAIWGAPHSNGTEHYDAVISALEMRHTLVEFNKRRLEAKKPIIKFGIGLHSGPCVSGIIGSEERLEYSVIGDTVNVCSRIESMTKVFGVDILVTAALKEKVASKFMFEELRSVAVKGKKDPISVYTIKGFYDKAGKPVVIESPYANYRVEI